MVGSPSGSKLDGFFCVIFWKGYEKITMNKIPYSISCIIKNQRDEYLTDNGWNKDCNRAVLFAPQQADATIKALSEKATLASVKAAYVIQNEKFNYHDGENDWVYNIADAMFYNSLQEAEAKAKTLSPN
ncbi:MAG: hypothetical protein Q8P45_00840 [Candidatus Harrisonbacteria bacterium]|nr:hypothetical protein [Candidatus Harrisonbacteria bacterium]